MLRPQRSGGALESDHDVNPMYRCLAPERGPEHIFSLGLNLGALPLMKKGPYWGQGVICAGTDFQGRPTHLAYLGRRHCLGCGLFSDKTETVSVNLGQLVAPDFPGSH